MKKGIILKYLTVFCMGFYGILSQTLLFRVFLSMFDGNEFSIGLFFFSWLIWVSIGAWVANRKTLLKFSNYFYLLILLYIPLYLIQYLLFINAEHILGSYSFEVISLGKLIPFLLLCNAPISIISGFLFVIATKWFPKNSTTVTKIYIYESLGSFIGALTVTILLYIGLTDERVFFIASLVLLAVTELYLIKNTENLLDKTFKFLFPVIITILCYITLSSNFSKIQNFTNRIEWNNYLKDGHYSGAFYTPQAKYLYGNYKEDFIVCAWNSTYESFPSTEQSSQTAAEYLSQNPLAKNILVVGPGTLSLCQTFAGLDQVTNVTWLETDPNYTHKLLKVLPEKYLIDMKKITVPEEDIRNFLKDGNNKYDIIVLNLPTPNTLLLNRYFTYEFFQQLKTNLSPQGIVGINFPAEANFLGPELSFTGGSLLFTLGKVFKDIVLKPGQDSCFFAAAQKGLVTEKISNLIKRLKNIRGIEKIYNPEHIASVFEKTRINFQISRYKEIIDKYPEKLIFNTDSNPKSFLYTLLFTVKKLGNISFSESDLRSVLNRVFPLCILSIILYFLLRVFYYYYYYVPNKKINEPSKTELYFCIFAAALSSLGLNLLFMFLFQIYFGSVFLYFGIITALFMLGLFISSIITRHLTRFIQSRSLLIFISCIFLLFFLLVFIHPPHLSTLYFSFLFLAAGLICGPYFVIAAQSLDKQNINESCSASRLDFFDNLGGAVGSIVCSIVVLPIIGIDKTLILLSFLIITIILHSLILRGRAVKKQKTIILLTRTAGYFGFWIILFLLAGSILIKKTADTAESLELKVLPWTLNEKQKTDLDIKGKKVEPKQHIFNGTPCTYYAVKEDDNIIGYIFRTKDYEKDIKGFAGPIHMLSYINSDGRIQNFTIIEANETPAYLNHALNSKNKFLGQNVKSDSEDYKISAVTGATISSTAISKTLYNAGNKFLSTIKKKSVSAVKQKELNGYEFSSAIPIMILILFSIIAVLLRVFYNRKVRLVFIFAVLILLGFIYNIQFSVVNAISLLSFKSDFSHINPFLYLTIGIPLLIIIFGNFYCGYLCPFGILQELSYTIINKQISTILPKIDKGRLSRNIWVFISSLKYFLLFIIIFALIFSESISPIENIDILTHFFSFTFTPGMRYFIIAILITCIFFKRFWCRILCPSGAFLSIFNSFKLFFKVDIRLKTGKCDIGITDIKAIDCICCDNCRTKQPDSSCNKKNLFKSYLLLILSISFTAFMIIQMFTDYGLNSKETTKPKSNITLTEKTIPVNTKIIENKKEQPVQNNIKSISSPRNINLNRYKKFIDKGYLSDKEAMFYRKVD